jgi:formiminoglutamase
MSAFTRPPAADDPSWPRASAWLAGGAAGGAAGGGAAGGGADLVVVGVPCSVGSISPSEAWRTPPVVRDALARLSPFDPDPDAGVDLAALAVRDAGDWPVADLALEPALAAIRDRAAALDRSVPLHLFLGGDNAITRPLAAGLLGPDLGRVGLLTLDAHHDVRTLDRGPGNGTPVRGLLADGLPGANVHQIGIGAFTNSAAYAAWAAAQGITAVTADRARRDGVGEVVQAALDDLAGRCDAVYVDLDVDVLDVAFAPACPGARPGGLSPAELLDAARRCGAHPAVRAVDLVEVDAAADHDGRTVMATAMAVLAVASGLVRRCRAR